MISLKLDTSKVESMFESVKTLEHDLKKDAYQYFKNIIPIRTGNARRNTYQSGSGDIQANYPYAGRLDEGYSRQAPRGMSDPTMDHMEQVFDKLVADAENKG